METKENGNEPMAERPKGRYRMDVIRWDPDAGKHERITGFAWGDDIDALVETTRHPKKNGGFDRAMIYLIGENGSEKIVENVHSVMGRLYCHGRTEFTYPTIAPRSVTQKSKKTKKEK
jgi:hypothetical protein